MMDLARQNIVNQEIPARLRYSSFRPHSGREPGGPDDPTGVSRTPFWVLWVVSHLLSVALGMALMFALQGGAG